MKVILNFIGYTTPNDRMNDEFERIQKEAMLS